MHARLNRRIFLESTAAIMAAPSAALGADEAERRRIRVASFNIQIGRGTDGKYDLKRTANAIRLMKPDVIGLQEVDRGADRSDGEDQARTLADLLDMHFAFGKASDRPGGEYGNAVLSRWPIAEQNNHLLRSWGEQRAVLSATVDVPHAGPIRFLSAHLHSPNRERQHPQRIGQIEQISRLFARGGSPVILAADVNARPDSEELKRLDEAWIDEGRVTRLFLLRSPKTLFGDRSDATFPPETMRALPGGMDDNRSSAGFVLSCRRQRRRRPSDLRVPAGQRPVPRGRGRGNELAAFR